MYIQTKKAQETKKTSKLPTLKEKKEIKALKPILKESTESLGKLRIEEDYEKNSIIDRKKVEKYAALLNNDQNSHNVTPELPDDIEDIDAGDNYSPLLMSIYAKDIYKYLTELEEKYPIETDHLRKQVCRFNNFLRYFSLVAGLQTDTFMSCSLCTVHNSILWKCSV